MHFGDHMDLLDTRKTIPDSCFRAAFEESKDAICIYEVETRRLVDANSSFQRLLGYEPWEIPSLTVYDFSDNSRHEIDALIDRVLSEDQGITEEQIYHRKDGSQVTVVVTVCKAGKDGGDSLLVSIARDVSEERHREQELGTRDHLLAGVALATNLLLTTEEYTSAMNQALELLGCATDVDRVYLYENRNDPLTGEVQAALRYRWERGEDEDTKRDVELEDVISYDLLPRWRMRFSVNRPIFGLVRNLPEEEREMFTGRGTISVAILPVNIEGVKWGFIGFEDCRTERNWTYSEVSILLAAGGSIGGAIARKKAEYELIRSKEMYQELVECANSIILRMDTEGRVTFFNEFAQTFFGYTEREILGKKVIGTIVPETESTGRDLRQMIHDVVVKPESYTTNINENMKKNGERVWIAWSNRKVLDDAGDVVELLCIGNDITERRLAEERIRSANQQLLDIIDFLPDATFVINSIGHVIAWNRAIEEMTGVSKAEMMGKGDYEYSVPFYGIRRPILIDLVSADESSISLNYDRFERKGLTLFAHVFVPSLNGGLGAYLWAKASPLLDARGDIVGAIESMRDITEQMEAERELLNRDRLLAGSALAISRLLTTGDYESAIQEALKILGMVSNTDRVYVFKNHESDAGEHLMSQRFEWCREGVTPQIDNQILQDLSYEKHFPGWYEVLSSGHVVKGLVSDFSEEAREILEPLQVVSMLVVPIMIKDRFWGIIGFNDCAADREWTDGEVSILFTFGGNIGESVVRKEAEDRLRLLESVVVNSIDTVVIAQPDPSDGDPRIVYVNPAFTRMTGWSAEEVIGKLPNFLLGPDPDISILEKVRSSMMERRSITLEVEIYRKDGSNLWVEINIVPVTDENGEVTHWVSVQRDTTERRIADERLRWNDALMRSMAENSPLAFYVVDNRTDSILYFNYRFCEIWNLQGIEERMRRGELKSSEIAFYCRSNLSDNLSVPNPFSTIPVDERQMVLEDEIQFEDGRIIRRFSTEIRDSADRYFGQLYIFEDITDRKVKEHELIQTRNYLESIVNYANAPIIVWDSSFRITRFNHAFEHLTGYVSEEVVGRSLAMLFPEDTRARSLAKIEQTLTGEKWESVEIPILRKDGGVRTVLWNSANIYSDDGRSLIATVAHGTDITDRKRAQEQILFQASLLDQVRNAVIATDLEGRIIYWNRFAEELYQWTTGEVLGKRVQDTVVPQKSIPKPEELMRMLSEAGYSEGEYTVRRKDGSTFQAYYVFSVITDLDDEPLGFVGVSVDITERAKVETELRRAKEDAETAARAKAEFLANMSHEIRTPMNAIIGMTGLLLETELSPAQRDYVETIRSSGDSLLEIISDILDFSKAEGGKLEMERHPFDLRECIEASLDLVSAKAAEKGLEIIYFMDPSVPPYLIGDAARLRQVLVNLLSNAVKFTEKGEVVLSVSSKGMDEGFHEFHFSVRDTGVGIPEDLKFKLFKSFSQIDTSITRRYGGTGLGLAISKHLVQMMGGKIWVQSVPGDGSVFHFTVIERSYKPSDKQEIDISRLSGMKVLVVDPSDASRRMIGGHLSCWSMRPTCAESSARALEILSGGERFDLAVINMMVPTADGSELIERMRSLSGAERLPVIALTSLYHRYDMDKSPLVSPISKPVKPSQLLDAIMDLLLGIKKEVPVLSPARASASKSLSILLAEDNAVNRKVALLMLERLGYRADVATDGYEVLRALQRQKYDLVLMDIQMPEMDGLEATRRIRELWPTGGPAIIAITAYALEGDREKCLCAGMDDYISKPIKLDELRAAIDRVGAANEDRFILDPQAISNLRELQEEGEPDIVAELAGIFLEHAPSRILSMKMALEKGDFETLFMEAHSMKSSSASIGALKLSAICKELETIGREEKPDRAKELIAELAVEFDRVRTSLDDLISDSGGDSQKWRTKGK